MSRYNVLLTLTKLVNLDSTDYPDVENTSEAVRTALVNELLVDGGDYLVEMANPEDSLIGVKEVDQEGVKAHRFLMEAQQAKVVSLTEVEEEDEEEEEDEYEDEEDK